MVKYKPALMLPDKACDVVVLYDHLLNIVVVVLLHKSSLQMCNFIKNRDKKFLGSNLVTNCANNITKFCDKTENPEALRRRIDFCTSASILSWK